MTYIIIVLALFILNTISCIALAIFAKWTTRTAIENIMLQIILSAFHLLGAELGGWMGFVAALMFGGIYNYLTSPNPFQEEMSIWVTKS